jgi:hypothetical protein
MEKKTLKNFSINELKSFIKSSDKEIQKLNIELDKEKEKLRKIKRDIELQNEKLSSGGCELTSDDKTTIDTLLVIEKELENKISKIELSLYGKMGDRACIKWQYDEANMIHRSLIRYGVKSYNELLKKRKNIKNKINTFRKEYNLQGNPLNSKAIEKYQKLREEEKKLYELEDYKITKDYKKGKELTELIKRVFYESTGQETELNELDNIYLDVSLELVVNKIGLEEKNETEIQSTIKKVLFNLGYIKEFESRTINIIEQESDTQENENKSKKTIVEYYNELKNIENIDLFKEETSNLARRVKAYAKDKDNVEFKFGSVRVTLTELKKRV